MTTNFLPPIPQDKIGETFNWREWFLNLGTYITGVQTGGAPWSVSAGGTGTSTLTGYVKGSGTTPLTGSSTIPITDITGLDTITALEIIEYNVPITGFSYTIANSTNILVLEPAGILATGTVTMPLSPVDKQVVRLTSTQTITGLTMAATGQTLKGALTTIAGDGFASWVYKVSTTTWYRIG